MSNLTNPIGSIKSFQTVRAIRKRRGKLFLAPYYNKDYSQKIIVLDFTLSSFCTGNKYLCQTVWRETNIHFNRMALLGRPLRVCNFIMGSEPFEWFTKGSNLFVFENYWHAYAHLIQFEKEAEEAEKGE